MTTLTIGQLARLVGLRTSALRYYEEQGLLTPTGRTEAGYRLYTPDAEQTLRFIKRAQRLGFSLADIRLLLRTNTLSDDTVVAVAENRYVALERRLTELQVMRHELELFLLDLRHRLSQEAKEVSLMSLFDRLLDQVCAGPTDRSSAALTLNWLFERTNCALTMLDEQTLLGTLRGRHVHIWQENEVYHILVVGHDPAVETALRELAQLEAECHAHPTPQLAYNEEGYLLTAHGENAFIFARLFLALEQETGL